MTPCPPGQLRMRPRPGGQVALHSRNGALGLSDHSLVQYRLPSTGELVPLPAGISQQIPRCSALRGTTTLLATRPPGPSWSICAAPERLHGTALIESQCGRRKPVFPDVAGVVVGVGAGRILVRA